MDDRHGNPFICIEEIYHNLGFLRLAVVGMSDFILDLSGYIPHAVFLGVDQPIVASTDSPKYY